MLLCNVVGLINIGLRIQFIDTPVYSLHFVPFFEKHSSLSGANVRKQNILCAFLPKVLNIN